MYLAYFYMLFVGVYTTRYWQTYGRLVRKLNICTVNVWWYVYAFQSIHVQAFLFLFKHVLSFSLTGMLRKAGGGGVSAAIRRSSDDYVAPEEHRHRRKVRDGGNLKESAWPVAKIMYNQNRAKHIDISLTYVHTYMDNHGCIPTYIHTYTHIHTYTNTYIRMYVRTYVHTHNHT